jgi:hypothetical protein
VYSEVTTEEDLHCFTAKVLSEKLYPGIVKEYDHHRGPGCWERLQEKWRADTADFPVIYEERVRKVMKARLINTTQKLYIVAEKLLNYFVKDTEELFKSNQYSNPRHNEARNILADWLPGFESTLQDIQLALPTQESIQPTKRLKRKDNRRHASGPVYIDLGAR